MSLAEKRKSRVSTGKEDQVEILKGAKKSAFSNQRIHEMIDSSNSSVPLLDES